jgi:hypothetical protein
MNDPRDQKPEHNDPNNPGRDPYSEIFSFDAQPQPFDPHATQEPIAADLSAPHHIDPTMMAPPLQGQVVPPIMPGPLFGVPKGGYLRAHSAGAILTLGIFSIVTSLPSFACCTIIPIPLVAMGIGVAAMIWGTSELRAMDAGTMDPSGRSTVNAGRACGLVGAIIAGLALLIGIALYVVPLFMPAPGTGVTP